MIKSIHFNRVPVNKVYTGYFCCLSLKSVKKKGVIDKKNLRKGVVILDAALTPKPVWGF